MPPAALIAVGVAMSLAGWVVLATDRAEPVKFGVRELALVMREGCVRAVLWTISPLAALESTSPPTGRAIGPRAPVLLVPGIGGGRVSLAFLRLFLDARGVPSVYAMKFTGTDPTLVELASEVGRAVEALIRASGAERIDVVAHGTGGLAAAWYAQHVDRGARIRRLVTLGTPWRGTRLAVFVRGRVGAEIVHGSALLDSLQPPIVPTVAIGSPDDTAVVPPSSAFPTGAVPVSIDGAGHLDLVASARAFRAVNAALMEGA